MLARCGLAALSGALYFGGYTGFGQFYLTWVCFVPVLLAVRGLRGWRTFGVGMVFGWVTQMGGFYWIAELLEGFAGLPGPLAWAATVLFCAYQGLVCAVTLVLVRRAEDSLGLAPVWTLPVVFPALELAFPLIFPNAIGYSQYRFTAITQIVEFSGLTGLGLLILAVNGGVYEALDAARNRRPRLARVAVPALAFALALGWGLWRIPAIERELQDGRVLRVALVQTNVGAGDKQALASESLPRHAVASRAALALDPSIELIVWPETVYYDHVGRRGGPVRGLIGRGIDVPLVFGAATAEFDDAGRVRELYNSMVLASARGDVLGIYDKIELVMLGETIPGLSIFPWLAQALPVPALLDRGKSYRHLVLEDGTKILPLICIEDIIPSLVQRIWQVSGPADVLVNVTNDSWYGDTHEPLHHLAMSTFRAIETRRSLIRSTNTGISALVDPLGRITAQTRVREATELIGDVALVKDGRSTLYMRRGEIAGAAAWALLAVGVVLDLRRRRV